VVPRPTGRAAGRDRTTGVFAGAAATRDVAAAAGGIPTAGSLTAAGGVAATRGIATTAVARYVSRAAAARNIAGATATRSIARTAAARNVAGTAAAATATVVAIQLMSLAQIAGVNSHGIVPVIGKGLKSGSGWTGSQSHDEDHTVHEMYLLLKVDGKNTTSWEPGAASLELR